MSIAINRDFKIDLVVIVQDEEKNINKLVRKKYGDNLIIVDSYSRDNTVNELSQYTKQIYSQKFINFSVQKNYAISKSNNEWILTLDADEEMSEGAQEVIRELVKKKDVDGYWFPRRNYINDKTYLKHGYFYPDWQLRLFRNHKGYKYSGIIHAQIQIPEKKTRYIKDVEILHSPERSKYNSWLSFFRLINYIKIEGSDLAKSKTAAASFFSGIFLETARHFFRCYYRKRGFLDGYNGFRAAVIFGLYQGNIQMYAFFTRLFRYDTPEV